MSVPAETYDRAPINTNTKEGAADELRFPFDVKVTNATTREAIEELEAGKGKRLASVADLMADLHAGD